MSDTPVTDTRAFRILSDLQSGTREVVDAEVAREFERKATPAISDEWVLRYCAATNRHPKGEQHTFTEDGPVSRTFFEMAKRELEIAMETMLESASEGRVL